MHAGAFAADPQLYVLLRSLDSVGAMVGPNTRLVLRTDAAPFRALVEGPVSAPEGTPAVPVPAPGGGAGVPVASGGGGSLALAHVGAAP